MDYNRKTSRTFAPAALVRRRHEEIKEDRTLEEILARVVRIETRLVKFMNAAGLDAEGYPMDEDD